MSISTPRHDGAPIEPWRAPADFADAIAAAGLGRPDIEPDGDIHRFNVEGDKAGTLNGWYALHLDGVPAGIFGSWKENQTQTWCAIERSHQTPAQQADFRRMVERAKAKRDAEARDKHAAARTNAAADWDAATAAGAESHPYLTRKGVGAHGVKVSGDTLLIPVRDTAGTLHGLQAIGADGAKRFRPGTAVAGHFHLIGTPTPGGRLCLAEGYATAATVHEATGAPVACAFNCGNMHPAAKALRAAHPDALLIVAGDDDTHREDNPGRTHAEAAARSVSADVIFPIFTDGAPDGRDWNDLARLEGIEAVRAQLEAVHEKRDTRTPEGDSLNDVHDVHHVHPDPIAAAVATCKEAIAKSAENPGVLAGDEFNAAARLLREGAPDEWFRLRGQIKEAARAAGLTMGDVERGSRPDSGPADDSSTADELVALVQEAAELFHAPDGTCYATLTGSGPRLTFRLDTAAFADWLSFRFYSETKSQGGSGRAASDTAIRTARTTLTGIARHEGDERPVYMRAARHGDAYYIDIGSELTGAIEVTAAGWRHVTRPPVDFWRPSTLRPLPMPVPGGDLSLLWGYANIPETARHLVLAWMMDACRPETPFAVLELVGQQGTAKSSTQAKLRRCIDPNAVDLRSAPKSVEDLFVSAGANWVASLNNLSHLSAPMQDALCNLATGGGFAGRTLFTNSDETLIEAKRPVMLNGIVPMVTAQDLTDRVIHIDLPELDTYRTETAIDADFEQDAPQIIGGLLDLFVKTLAALPAVSLPKPPRMADYAALGEAMLRAEGEPAGAFLAIYQGNRADSVARSLEASPIACAVRRLIEDHPASSPLAAWDDTMGKLLDRLSRYRDGADAWPKSARGLGEVLRRQRPALSQIGISVEIGKAGKHGVPVTIRAKRDGEHGEHGERRSDGKPQTRVCDPETVCAAEVF